jgi:uncharacterized protein
LIRWRWFVFAIAVTVVCIAFPASVSLRLDRSLNKMFAPKDPTRIGFEQLQAKFGVADLVVFAYRDASLWQANGSGLERLQAVRTKLEQMPGMTTVMDLSKIDSMLSSMQSPLGSLGSFGVALGQGNVSHPLLDPNNNLAQRFKNLFEGQTHARQSDLVALACLLNGDQSDALKSKTIASMRAFGNELPQSFGVPKALMVGQPVMVDEGFEAIEADGLRLGMFSSVSLMLLILIGFRSLRWAFITLAVVQWSLVVTRALLVWLAWDLTMVSSMLTSIVTVIGVATTMHWMLGYRHAMRVGQQPEAALASSIGQLWQPIMWACITDAIGFASLSFAKVGPVQDYGCMMALASLVVLVGIFAIVPALALVSFGSSKWIGRCGLSMQLSEIPGDRILDRFLGGLLRLALSHSLAVAVLSLLLTVVAIWGTLTLQVETDFIKNFKQDAPLVVAYQAIESELGGAGVWDVIVPVPKSMTQSYLDQVMSLEEKLRAIEIESVSRTRRVPDVDQRIRLTQVMSFADADLAARESTLLSQLTIEARLLGMKQVMGSFIGTMIQPVGSQDRSLRIMLRSREQSEASQKERLIEEVKRVVSQWTSEHAGQFGTEQFRTNQLESSVSGYYVMLAELVSSVVADQWRCFAVATVGIWLAMTLALRSFLLATLAILPNAIPSMCILGFMGWMDMRVNLGAAMIAAVSMGLSVDSSLHYLMRLQSDRRKGHSTRVALRAAQSEIGMAMLLSTIALVLGFGSMIVSDFVPTVVFGLTASLSMLGGLLGNLFLLPALINLFSSKPDVSRTAAAFSQPDA